MGTTDVPVSDDLIAALGVEPAAVPRALAEAAVLELYRRHDVSAGYAAVLLGMDKWAFIRRAGELGIPYVDMTVVELRREARRVAER